MQDGGGSRLSAETAMSCQIFLLVIIYRCAILIGRIRADAFAAHNGKREPATAKTGTARRTPIGVWCGQCVVAAKPSKRRQHIFVNLIGRAGHRLAA